MLEGRIVEYDAELGYGYLKTADGSRLFVHSTEVYGKNGKHLKRGRHVTFDIYRNEKGAVAVNIRPAMPAKRSPTNREF